MSMPMAATQLPATRTTILAQFFFRETTNAEISATSTKSAAMIPISPSIPTGFLFQHSFYRSLPQVSLPSLGGTK